MKIKLPMSAKRIDELGYYLAEHVVNKELIDKENLNNNSLLIVLDEDYEKFLQHLEGTGLINESEKEILIENIDDLDAYIKEEAIEYIPEILEEVTEE